MGFPSNFKLFQALASDKNNPDHQAAKEFTDEYKMFAIILHDPKIHFDFDHILKTSFENLDYFSGGSLMFFAMTNPSNEWYDKNRSRKYFENRFFKMHYSEVGLISDHDPLKTTAIAKSFDLDFSDLPAILLTNSLSSKNYTLIRTDGEQLQNQILTIGRHLKENPELKHNDPILIKALDAFNITETVTIKKLHVVKILANVLGIIDPYGISEEEYQRMANENFESLLKNFVEIRNKTNITSKDLNFIENLGVAFASTLPPVHPVSMIINDFVENESKIFYETFIRLRTFYNEFERYGKESLMKSQLLYAESTGMDYSSLIIQVAKIFELESNLSIVQWMRQNVGIKMPDYYCKLAPYQIPNYIYNDKNHFINLNESTNGRFAKWKAPNSGGSLQAFRKMLSENNKPVIPNYKEILNEWTQINYYRNPGAHIESMNKHRFEEISFFIEPFLEKDINELIKLKRILKGEID